MPRPDSHAYQVKQARLRKRYENMGVPDDKAGERAKEELQQNEQRRPVPRGARAAGPKGERG